MRVESTPTTTAHCWKCGTLNPTHLLPHVRRIICANDGCLAIHPSEPVADYLARKKLGDMQREV